MFGIGVGIRVGGRTPVGGSAYDADAQAFFDRVTTAGGTLTTNEKNATNQLVLDMKSAGIWTSMKAVYPMVGASAAACAQNLKSSSFTGTFSSGWTFASTGVTGNGTSAYFDTTFNPFVSSNGVNDTSSSIYIRTATQGATTQTDLGCFSTSNALPLVTINSNNASLRVNYCWDYVTNVGTTTTGDSRGMWGMSRSGASAWVSFDRNTSVSKTTTNTYTTLPNANVYLGAQNGNGTTIEFSPRQIAFAHMGNNLTATQFNNLYTAVQTFNQTLNRQVGAQVVSDADAQAYINRVYTAGGTLTNTEANAVNQLTIDMKAAGVWTSMKAIYPMVGASAAACAQNLKSSSFTGTFTSGWTFASTGVTPNGTSAYFNTGLIPSVDLTQNSTHLSYYSRTNLLSGDRIDMGTATGTNGTSFRTYIIMYFSGASYSNINSASDTIVTTMTDTRKFVLAYRNNSLNFVNQVNSTQQTLTSVSGGLSDKSFYIGAFNRNGTADNFSPRQNAFASIGDGLTDTQASNFYTAVQAFQTTLSRQV